MREVRRSALVPHTPAQMYALVNDVRRYPEFLRWCPRTTVLAETADSITATVYMERAGIHTAVTTTNTLRPGERIDMALDDGPLAIFAGRWQFVPICSPGADDRPAELKGCRVELELRFEFRNRALGLLFGPLFEATWDSLVDAFVKRARAVYR